MFPKAKIHEDKQMEGSAWGFDPVTEFDSDNPNKQMEANSSIKRQSVLASSKYPANSSQSPPLPGLDVYSAANSQETKTWATRSTDRLLLKTATRKINTGGSTPYCDLQQT
jgi:hypothetical protein